MKQWFKKVACELCFAQFAALDLKKILKQGILRAMEARPKVNNMKSDNLSFI